MNMTLLMLFVLLPLAIFSIFGRAYPFVRGCPSSQSGSYRGHSNSLDINTATESHSIVVADSNTKLVNDAPIDSRNGPIPLVPISSIKGFSYLEQPASRKRSFQRLTYSWVGELLEKGNKRPDSKPLELPDLWKLGSYDQMANVSSRFDEFFERELSNMKRKNRTPFVGHKNVLLEFWSYPVTRAIVKMYKKEFAYTGVLKFFNTCVQFLPSIIIARILKLVSSGGINTSLAPKSYLKDGFALSAVLFLVLSTKTFLENAYFYHIINLAASVRGALSTAIFRKSLRLNPQGRQNFTIGEVSNYLQLDTNRMEQVAGSIHTVWDGIFQIVGYTSLLLAFLGPSVFAGIAAMLVIIPLNAYFLVKLSSAVAKTLKFTDKRVKLTSEIFQGIRAIKSYNWETPFLLQLNKLRENEVKSLKRAANIRAIFVSILSAAPSFVAVVTLFLYAFLGNELNPMKVFTALALFNQLRFPIIFFPLLLNTLADGKVSLRRLSSYLTSSEVQNYVINPALNSSTADTVDPDEVGSIEISGGDFAWSAPDESANSSGSTNTTKPQSSRGRLKNIDISIEPGELVAVIGPVGSGKSMLISALLGELALLNGTVSLNGRVAYVPQSAWIPNDSLRNVILFGKEYSEKFYNETIASCGLTKDLENLDAGDSTEIGERGVNLSGGQRQRISIARAVYDDADIYLFDDPLSALDADVRKKVFDQCIDGILSEKTRILVTHQLSVLSEVDSIIIMNATQSIKGGITTEACEIVDQGTYQELKSRGYDFSSFVKSESPAKTPEEKASSDNTPSAASLTVGDSITSDAVIENEILETIPNVLDPAHIAVVEDPKEEAITDASTSSKWDTTESDPDTVLSSEQGNKRINEIVSNEQVGSSEGVRHVDPENTAEVLKSSHDEDNLRRRLPGSSLPLPDTSVITSNRINPGPSRHENVSSDAVSNITESVTVPVTVTKVPKKLIVAEERSEGAVGWSIYKQYIAVARSPLLIFAILASFAVANFAQIGQLWVVSAWTSDIGYKKFPLSVYLCGMASMAVAVAFFNWSRTFMTYIVGTNASKALHFSMAKKVLKAPLSYFESIPVGRLMQRFSKDLDSMDTQLPGSMGQFVACILNIVGAMMAVCVATPSFVFIMAPVFTVYIMVTNYFRKVARELKRLDSISRSPIYAHFGETLGGLSVLRSFQRQNLYRRMNEVKLDDNLAAYYNLKAVDRWLSLRLEFLGNILVFFSSMLAIMAGSKAGVTGISLNNALSITSLLNWAVRNGAETESLMNSVERVLYIATNTPSELSPMNSQTPIEISRGESVNIDLLTHLNKTESFITEADMIASSWPWRGGVVFENTKMSYRPDFDPVLKGINLAIRPGERIGVVGRTGSGKSSLFRALLRLTEIESDGAIYIDGININSISMDTLRSAVSIIPQDPVLFSGTLRFNLDPFNLRTDDELWLALRKANLEGTVRALSGGLSYMVSEGGENFSAGQRQLLCLARALVRKSKLLLLDEATSSVDHDTDVLIQKAIRKEFSSLSSTVLTIAHRLDTIIDADRILVMKDGRVAEFDTPANLLKNKNSLFTQLLMAENEQKRSQNKRPLRKKGGLSISGVLNAVIRKPGSSKEKVETALPAVTTIIDDHDEVPASAPSISAQ